MVDQTTNHGWNRPETDTDTDDDVWGQLLNGTIDDLDVEVILKGTTTGTPPTPDIAAGTAGRWYLATDTNDPSDSTVSMPFLYYDDGTDWVVIYDGDARTFAGETADKYARTDQAETFNASITVPGVKYSTQNWGVYDSLKSGDNLHLGAIAKKTNVYRGKTLSNIEYNDGTSWVAWSPGDFGNLVDGDDETNITTVDETHSQFRFTIDVGAWSRSFAVTLVKAYGSGGFDAAYTATLETSSDQSTWTTRYSGSPTPSYQDAITAMAEHGDRYHRWSFDVSLGTGETFDVVELALWSADTSKNPDPIQNTDATSARSRGDFDVGGQLSEQGSRAATRTYADSAYTDENARDAAGAMATNGLSYDDANDTLGQNVVASGQVTLSSGAATIDTGVATTTTATFQVALGPATADADVGAEIRADSTSGTYQVDIVESPDTAVGNPSVEYDIIRIR